MRAQKGQPYKIGKAFSEGVCVCVKEAGPGAPIS